MPRRISLLILEVLVLIFFTVDRVLKFIFSRSSGEYFIFGDWFKFKSALNSGIAFGILIPPLLSLLAYLLISLFLIYFAIKYFRERKNWLVFSLSLIIAGAFSNFLDRIYSGGVIDYLEIKYLTVFNLADAMIAIGVILIIVKNLKLKKLEIRI